MAQTQQPQRQEQRIDDLVVLGRAGPETLSDGRVTVCLGGWSESRGYIRLYPTQKRMTDLKRWNKVSVPVEHDPGNDNRNESYKIAGSKTDWDTLHRKIRVVGRWEKPERLQFVDTVPKQCSSKLNDLRYSLGIVEPETIHDAYLVEQDDYADSEPSTKETKTNHDKLYIEYSCRDCGVASHHRQHCIEWGMYQFWKHNPERDPDEAIDALRLLDDDYKKYFFVGNMANRRNSYIVISVLRFKKSELDGYESELARNSTLGAFCGASGGESG